MGNCIACLPEKQRSVVNAQRIETAVEAPCAAPVPQEIQPLANRSGSGSPLFPDQAKQAADAPEGATAFPEKPELTIEQGHVVAAKPADDASEGMGLTAKRTDNSIIITGEDGWVEFRGNEFELVEDDNSCMIVSGPFHESILCEEAARKFKIEYYGRQGWYVISMVNSYKSGFGPNLMEQMMFMTKRLKKQYVTTSGNGNEGFSYNVGGGKEAVLVPDHNFFRASDGGADQRMFPKVYHQIVQEVESKTDPRKRSSGKLTTFSKCRVYLQSGQVEFVIAWYPRTKEAQLHWRDAAGQPMESEIFFDPEFLPMDHWPGGIFAGFRLYLSELRAHPHLWTDFDPGEKWNPDGTTPRLPGRNQAPVDSPEVRGRQKFFEDQIHTRDMDERYDVVARAARELDLEALRLAVSFVDTVNTRSKDGRVPMVEAVAAKSLPKVKELLLQGADANLEDGYGRSAMAMAVILGAEGADIVTHLRTLGVPDTAVPVQVGAEWLVAITSAKQAPPGLLEEMAELLEAHAQGSTFRALQTLVAAGNGDRVLKVLHARTGRELIDRLLGEDPEQLLCIIRGAAESGMVESLRALHEFNLLDVKGEGGETALMRLAEGVNFLSVRALVRAGAALDVTDDSGLTALAYARRRKRAKVAQELVRLGAEGDMGSGGEE